MRTAIIGGGGWGLALAGLLAGNGHPVLVWEHDPTFLEILQAEHGNPVLLPGITLPAEVSFTGSMDAVADLMPELIILATPSQFIRSTLRAIPTDTASRLWGSSALEAIVNVAKGIEQRSLDTIDRILFAELPPDTHSRICALSGPSHAEEVARHIPTTVVIAGNNELLLKKLQGIFSNAYFRVYRSSDLIGVEIGGAVKNIIAIAAGIVAGLGFGDNTIGALLTRGIVEIQRFGVAMGAKAETFLGLSGIGDLITTATSTHSRNRFVGFEIGKGRSLKAIMADMKMVAEGVATTASVYELAQRMHVEMPITTQVYKVLYEDKAPRTAIADLMTRELKAE